MSCDIPPPPRNTIGLNLWDIRTQGIPLSIESDLGFKSVDCSTRGRFDLLFLLGPEAKAEEVFSEDALEKFLDSSLRES